MTGQFLLGKRKRKRSAGSGASVLVGGIATNEITTFLVEAEAEARKRKRGSGSGGSGTKILKSASLLKSMRRAVMRGVK